jgi:hypothetical protein
MNTFNKTHFINPAIRNLIAVPAVPVITYFGLGTSYNFISFYKIKLANIVFFSTTHICLTDIPSDEKNSEELSVDERVKRELETNPKQVEAVLKEADKELELTKAKHDIIKCKEELASMESKSIPERIAYTNDMIAGDRAYKDVTVTPENVDEIMKEIGDQFEEFEKEISEDLDNDFD